MAGRGCASRITAILQSPDVAGVSASAGISRKDRTHPYDRRHAKDRFRRVSSVAMSPAEDLLTERTADTQARRWESVQVPLGDLGSGPLGMGGSQHGAPDAGLSIRGLAITELTHGLGELFE
jgi:hypothetical protein